MKASAVAIKVVPALGKVYVCAPYGDAIAVRDMHSLLRHYGFTPTSRWAERANGPENLLALSLEELRATAAQNDADIDAADMVLVRSSGFDGGEMFAQVARALERKKPIYWYGRRILSAYRAGVLLLEDFDDAIVAMRARASLGVSSGV